MNEQPTISLDNRGLEPPQPMMRILELLPGLAPGAALIAHNDREPLFLYPVLQDEGYSWETEQQADGSYFVRIWKPEGRPQAT